MEGQRMSSVSRWNLHRACDIPYHTSPSPSPSDPPDNHVIPQTPLPFPSPQPMNDDRSFNHACLEKENFTSNEKKRKKIFLENLFEKS